MAEGLRIAVKNHGGNITGEHVKEGFEQIKDFDLGGFLPPLTVTPQDHEGGGWLQIYETKGESLVQYKDWFKGYRQVILDQVKKAGMEK